MSNREQTREAAGEGTISVKLCAAEVGSRSRDRVRIGDKEFVFSYFVASPGYHRTGTHGGALIIGASARVRYLGETIVKTEVRK